VYKTKREVLSEYPELELTEFGDFKIKEDYVRSYEIIDFHCHLFEGLKEVFPNLLRKEKHDMGASFFDESCFPLSLKLFDINEVAFTKYPESVISMDGIRTKIKLQIGGLLVRKATPERLLRDMKLNSISKAVVMQINPANKNVAEAMNKIVENNRELITFGSIHPKDTNIQDKIDRYLSLDIYGWKINPHVCGFKIDDRSVISLLKKLSTTNMPIVSCSGSGVPDDFLSKRGIDNQQGQRIKSFYPILKEIPNTTFIFAHGGMYEVDELIELMGKYPNTYADISLQPPQNIRKFIEKLGSERLLFGTDYPFLNQAFSIVSLLRGTSNEEERKNIFSLNARRILDM